MARIRICKEKSCKDQATTSGFCRLHYLKNWKKVREEKRTKAAKKLNRYIEYICQKSPDKYLDEIRKDIAGGDFEAVQQKLQNSSDTLFGDIADEEMKHLIKHLKAEKDF